MAVATVPILRNRIGGAWHEPLGAELLDVPDPATGRAIARVPLSDAAAVDAAVQSAEAAQPAWAAVPVAERVRVCYRLRELMEDQASELRDLIVRENGKTQADAQGEVRRALEVVELSCGMPTLMMGRVLADVSRGIDCEEIRYPVGVCGVITPFNFPLMVPMWTLPLAIAAGNAVVCKPSERTPTSAIRIVELFEAAGLPPGLLNLVHGARAVVTAICEHPGIRAVSFVGSQPVAAYVYRTASAHGKRVQALAGAKNHLVVMPDADLAVAVPAIMSSAFGGAGQRCLAGSVVVAVGEAGDRIVAALAEASRHLRVGPGADPETGMGPVIRDDSRTRITGYIEAGVREGATLVCDGRGAPVDDPAGSDGFFLGPTIFDHVTPAMSIAREEIFGPVLSVVRTDTLDGALAIVNASRFGNAASIFTQSGGAARRWRQGVEAGMLGVNIGVAAPVALFPFSGWKDSFYGDLHATGLDGMHFFTRRKVVTSRF